MALFPSSRAPGPVSPSLVLSYVFDWLIIVLIAVAGYLFAKAAPNHRPFSLIDPNISFPYTAHERISTGTLFVVALVAPAIIIVPVCLFVNPLSVPASSERQPPRALIWRRKLWEWHTAWMGLALALVSSFMITQGSKVLFGKPRPDLLARCLPNLDASSIANHTVGGFGDPTLSEGVLVAWQICQQSDRALLNDGFQSFPSGHASSSWSGMIYLSLFLCSKLAIAIPFLLPRSQLPRQRQSLSKEGGSPPSSVASPPTYLLVFAFIPIGAAIYITSTRFSDFRHHGFDLIVGSLLGFLTAWGAFRWFHEPVRSGSGRSWGARGERSAWIGSRVQGETEWGWEELEMRNEGLRHEEDERGERFVGEERRV